MKFPGVISFLNALPICATPKGIFMRVESRIFLKFTKTPWVTSPLRYVFCFGSVVPKYTSVRRLKVLGSVHFTFPLCDFSCFFISCSWSALILLWQTLHSTSGSVKASVWPDTSHTLGFIIMAASIPTTSSRS